MAKIIIDKNKFSKIKAEIDSSLISGITMFFDSELQSFLFFLLLNVSDRDIIHRGIDIHKGQIFISKKEIHDALKISYMYLNGMIEKLKERNFIDYQEITLNQSIYLLITVIDCDCYKIEFEG